MSCGGRTGMQDISEGYCASKDDGSTSRAPGVMQPLISVTLTRSLAGPSDRSAASLTPSYLLSTLLWRDDVLAVQAGRQSGGLGWLAMALKVGRRAG